MWCMTYVPTLLVFYSCQKTINFKCEFNPFAAEFPQENAYFKPLSQIVGATMLQLWVMVQ